MLRRFRSASALLAALLVLSLTGCWGSRDPSEAPVRVTSPAGDLFANGACISLRPTRGDRHLTVFVDPGHGGPDPGTSGTTRDGRTVFEKGATLAVGLDLASMLRADGFRVVLSRTRDTAVARLGPSDVVGGALTLDAAHRDVVARVECANASGAELLLSIHFNAFDDPSVGGTETFYDEARPFAADNQRFAELVQREVVAAMARGGWNTPDRGIAPDTSIEAPQLSARAAAYPHLLELGPAQAGWLDTPSKMPGVLCEPLFLSDPFEADIAASRAGQQALAGAFARAIDNYFAGRGRATPTSTPTG